MNKKMYLLTFLVIIAAIIVLAISNPVEAKILSLTPIEELGKLLFFDKALSYNNNQSCATCHGAAFGYTGPDGNINAHGAVYPGSIETLFGNRKPPTAAYGGESPLLYYDEAGEVWVGGMFWDGRATGWILGDPLAEQAKGPFLNPVEQAVPDAQTLCMKVFQSSYAGLFSEVWGEFNCDTPEAVARAYDQIGYSLSAYERSYEVNPFNSKFDSFWTATKAKGLDVTQINMSNWQLYKNLGLKNDELFGLAIFNDQGKCALCHPLDEGSAGFPLFTDFTYDNTGFPKNLENPVYATDPDFIDLGLGNFLMSAGYPPEVYEPELGKFKVPTLRNVDKREGNIVKAYGHNGYFKSLEDIVHFYNTRDAKKWPAPEYAETVNMEELGKLRLKPKEERALVSFLKTLTDQTVLLTPAP